MRPDLAADTSRPPQSSRAPRSLAPERRHSLWHPSHCRLFGQSGQLLAERNVTGAGGTIQSFAVSNYPPGNYLIQVTTADGAKQVNKVMISK